ncbi:uncharacterized protein LOC129909999 [Episyrphus balteatus]|uniref:uncharacterized protein LOC129909999 n=1 Tax=Episyrphus balteatus TaxID=286459 RepID=UPI002484EE52|nr:uncharacterized protein LOC129909999 [Episyrphus balteatus]XP_055843190.1 uncharacterized protein LOC129909999 [Episyrphus balteatus]
MDNERIEIISDDITRTEKFNLTVRKINFKIKPVPENQEPISWISESMEGVFRHGLKGVDPKDKVGITFGGSFSPERGNGSLSFRTCSDITFEDVWEMMTKISPRSSGLTTDDDFVLTITSVKIPAGFGSY